MSRSRLSRRCECEDKTRVVPPVSCAQYCPPVSTYCLISRCVLYQMQYNSHETRLFIEHLDREIIIVIISIFMKFILFSSFSPFLSGPCPIEIHDSTSGPVNFIISTYLSTEIFCKFCNNF